MFDLPVMAYCSPDEQSKQLRAYLRSLGAEKLDADCKSDVAEDVADLVSNVDAVSTLTNENDVEMTLNSIISLLITVPHENSEPIVLKLCEKLNSDTFKDKEATLLHVLSNLLYGLNGSHRQQYKIYCAMLSLAAKSGLVRKMITDLTRIKEWFEHWRLSVDDQRALLRLLHLALSKGQQAEELAQVMFELLSTYTSDSDALKAKDDATECIRSAIADPGTYIFDHLLSLKPVQLLKGQKIYDLLQIFVSGSLSDYLKFNEANREFFDQEKTSLSHSDLVHKMRVLTLMTACENRTEINLNEVAALLQLIVGEELDEFIIRAVQSKAIRAKIDQVNDRLIVGGVKNRCFSNAQWEQLRTKLDGWSTSLRQVKRYLDNVVAVES